MNDYSNATPDSKSDVLETRWENLGRYLDYLEIRLWASRWRTFGPDADAANYREPDFISDYISFTPGDGTPESREIHPTTGAEKGQPPGASTMQFGYIDGVTSMDITQEEYRRIGWPPYLTRTAEEVVRDATTTSDLVESQSSDGARHFRTRVLGEPGVFLFLDAERLATQYARAYNVPSGFELPAGAHDDDIAATIREVAHELVMTANALKLAATIELADKVHEQFPTATDLICGIPYRKQHDSNGNSIEELSRKHGPVAIQLADEVGNPLSTLRKLDLGGTPNGSSEVARDTFPAQWLSPWIYMDAVEDRPAGERLDGRDDSTLKIFSVNLRADAIRARSQHAEYCESSPSRYRLRLR